MSSTVTVPERTSTYRKSQSRARVFIGGLDSPVTREDLEKAFGKYGRLESVWVAQNPPGFAFIVYEDERDAEDAVAKMNGETLMGNTLRVEHSRPKSFGGRRGAGGGGRFGGSGDYDSHRGGGRGGYGSNGGPYGSRSSGPYGDTRNGDRGFGRRSDRDFDSRGSHRGGGSSYRSYDSGDSRRDRDGGRDGGRDRDRDHGRRSGRSSPRRHD
ncbi:RNA-binding protein Rsf1, partial [Fragariocoptes setiger]